MEFGQNHITHFLCSTALVLWCWYIHAFEQIMCAKMQELSMALEQLSVTVVIPLGMSASVSVPKEPPAGLPHIQPMPIALARAEAFLEP